MLPIFRSVIAMRLDLYLFENSLAHSRSFAKSLITEGKVTVDSLVITKPSYEVSEGQNVEIATEEFYVSRGAYKLRGAVEKFGIPIKDRLCIDVGASSGGFTDYLLKNGAKKVIAVDSGSGHPPKRERRPAAEELTRFVAVLKSAPGVEEV